MRSPILRLPKRSSVHIPKEPMGPAPPARPRAYSPITPVEPIRMTKMKYGIKNVRPPQVETSIGNRQILPIPTAEPMQAMINPPRLRKPSRFCTESLFFICSLPFVPNNSQLVNILNEIRAYVNHNRRIWAHIEKKPSASYGADGFIHSVSIVLPGNTQGRGSREARCCGFS